jgi:branched-chain amino acid transport system substrate-binding protein
MTLTRRFAIGLGAAAAMIALAAPAMAQSNFVLYDLESLSGPGQSVGVPQANAIKLAVQQINNAGGFKAGSSTYKIDLNVVDDRSEPSAGVTAVQKMLSSGKPVFMIGSLSSAVTGAYAPIIKDRNDVISVVVGAALEGITESKAIYRPRFTLSSYTQGSADWLKKQGNFKRIAMLTDNKHSGFVQQTPALKAGIQAAGATIVAEEEYVFGATQFGSQISAITRANPDLVSIRGYGSDVARAIKQARDLGYKGPILVNSGLTPKDIADAQAQPAMEGVVEIFGPQVTDLIKGNKNAEKAKAFEEAYQKQFNSPSGATSLSAYGGVFILVRALEKAGTVTDVPKVRAALDALTVADVPEVVEPIRPQDGKIFKDRQAQFALVVRQWRDGALVPADFVE